jgi:predicted Fe-Mo cluster-binding NifX family protein
MNQKEIHMKIAVSAQSDSIEAKVSEKFGRCPFFIIIDSETGSFEAVKNPGIDTQGGAGPEAVRTIAAKGAHVALTGHLGPNAQAAIDAAGIKAITGMTETKTVRDTVESYLKDQ